mmetsp:Transcript_13231/g.31326  ORF Transcript_13231/g.31326 Transcript_13231/m.31326 type:complete len:322 (-) Transcript_13231:1533-2498(-)
MSASRSRATEVLFRSVKVAMDTVFVSSERNFVISFCHCSNRFAGSRISVARDRIRRFSSCGRRVGGGLGLNATSANTEAVLPYPTASASSPPLAWKRRSTLSCTLTSDFPMRRLSRCTEEKVTDSVRTEPSGPRPSREAIQKRVLRCAGCSGSLKPGGYSGASANAPQDSSEKWDTLRLGSPGVAAVSAFRRFGGRELLAASAPSSSWTLTSSSSSSLASCSALASSSFCSALATRTKTLRLWHGTPAAYSNTFSSDAMGQASSSKFLFCASEPAFKWMPRSAPFTSSKTLGFAVVGSWPRLRSVWKQRWFDGADLSSFLL